MPQTINIKHRCIRLITLLGIMLTLMLIVCVIMGLYGCEEEHTCDFILEWETPLAELEIFLLQQDLYQHDEAQMYCNNLVWEGKDDWRLPTECELSALASRLHTQEINDVQGNASELNSRMATCWSSTPYHDSLLRYWAVSVFNKHASPLPKNTYNAVICVRDRAR